MAISEASISSRAADEARKELETCNKDEIAAARADATPLSTPLYLKTADTLSKVQMAYEQFAAAFRVSHPGSSLEHPKPILFLSQPPMHQPSSYGDSACLALGKIGGEHAKELSKGHAFAWKKGEKQEFGDKDAIYIWFRVEPSNA